MTIRALVFVAYETLYDVESMRGLATELCGDKGELITQVWRLKQLEYSWLRGLMREYEDFSLVTRASLEFVLESAGVTSTPGLCEMLMAKYLDLGLYPEARQALTALGGYELAIPSNGSPDMLDALVNASGIAHLLTDVISVDRARTYKPDPKCYELVTSALGVQKHEVLFISSNGFDVAGAKQFGFRAAWVERGARGALPMSSNVGPAEFCRLLRGGAERQGHYADFRVNALTDLALVASSLAD